MKKKPSNTKKCDVCYDGKISCAEGGVIGWKVCLFCGGTGEMR